MRCAGQQLGTYLRLFGDRDHDINELIKLLFALRFGWFYHHRLLSIGLEVREIDGWRVHTVIHQPFGDIHGFHSVVLVVPPRNHALMSTVAVVGRPVVILQLRQHIVRIDDASFRGVTQPIRAHGQNPSISLDEYGEVGPERPHPANALLADLR